MHVLLVSFLLLTAASCANQSVRERRVAQVEEKTMDVSYDWNQDGIMDRAALEVVPGEDDYHEFAIYLSGPGGPKKIVSNDKFAYAYSNPGSYLEVMPNGYIRIVVDHSGIGASQSMNVWTVVYRDEQFVLNNYFYSFEDRLDAKKRGKCDLNLVTGEGKLNGTNLSFKPEVKNINLVNADFQPIPCKFKFN